MGRIGVGEDGARKEAVPNLKKFRENLTFKIIVEEIVLKKNGFEKLFFQCLETLTYKKISTLTLACK